MSVEEFRNSCPEDRNEDFYRGSFNCSKGHLLNAVESIAFAIEYFIDTEDPDFKEFDNCILRIMALLNKFGNRMSRQMIKGGNSDE